MNRELKGEGLQVGLLKLRRGADCTIAEFLVRLFSRLQFKWVFNEQCFNSLNYVYFVFVKKK